MPTVTVSGTRQPMVNTFWIAANIIFDLKTGETKDVLTLVNHEIDATFFRREDADLYYSFVTGRTAQKNIQWTIDSSNLRGQGWFVIRGVQNVG